MVGDVVQWRRLVDEVEDLTLDKMQNAIQVVCFAEEVVICLKNR